MQTYVVYETYDPIHERDLPHNRTPYPVMRYTSTQTQAEDISLLESYCALNSDEDSVLEYEPCSYTEHPDAPSITTTNLENAVQDLIDCRVANY